MDPNQLSLNCFVLGDKPNEVFTVTIPRTENVSKVKEEIKKKKAPCLDHVSATALELWKVDLFVDSITQHLTVDDIEHGPTLHSVKRIQSLFGEVLDDENVHVLVRSPSASHPVAAVGPTQILSINCLVLGDKPSKTFTVKISKIEDVGVLKDEIKKKKAPRLDHVAASDLELTRVSLALDDDLEENLKKVDLGSLEPWLLLLEVFPHVEANRLHIVIQVAPKEGKGEEPKRDDINGLHRRYRNLISNILNAASPSDSAKTSEYPKSLLAYSIYDGRYNAKKPTSSVAPPVQLFNPAFGHFLDYIRSDDAIPDDIIEEAAKYMVSASGHIRKRRSALRKVEPDSWPNADMTTPDGIVEHFDEEKNICSLHYLQEDKNEYGDGNSDPATQTGLSMGHCWAQFRFDVVRDATGCPTFLIATAGPWFVVLGAVITDGLIVLRLTNSIWVGLDCILNDSHIAQVARVFWALRMSLKKLRLYYEGVSPTAELPASSWYFPSITAYHDGEGLVEFEYVGFCEEVPECVTLHARTRTTPSQDIVVKFVDRYGERAHRLLADANLAPKLLYFGSRHTCSG